MKKLLICIAYFYSEERLPYLKKVLANIFNTYSDKFDLTVVIDTNTNLTVELLLTEFSEVFNANRLVVNTHFCLRHPYLLTWKHRRYMRDFLSEYDLYMYAEDDMLIPVENLVHHLASIEKLFPYDVMPVLLRVEEKDGVYYNPDNRVQPFTLQNVVRFEDRFFYTLQNPYQACWVLPAAILQRTIDDSFDREPPIPDSSIYYMAREKASSYTLHLCSRNLIEISSEKQVTPYSFAYHLPNNYIQNESWEWGNTPVYSLIQ